MTFLLQTAAVAAPPPTVLPLPRRLARDVLLAAAARATRLAVWLERVEATPRRAAGAARVGPHTTVRRLEAAVLVAVATYFAVGALAVLLGA